MIRFLFGLMVFFLVLSMLGRLASIFDPTLEEMAKRIRAQERLDGSQDSRLSEMFDGE
jgi:hypothetical protein